jgi:DNA modification methylase
MIYHGDCREVMATMDAASVDAIVTDPPYGLAFMGKGWDHAVPGVAFWAEALRVAKPGAHLVAFGGTRTFHRLACAIEDAGWEVRDTLSWLYGSGFPKSHNGPWGGTALKPAWEPIILARKPLVGTVAANVAAHGTGALNVDGCRIDASAGRPLIVSKAEPSLNAFGNGLNGSAFAGSTTLGRWPANVVLDEDAAARLDAQAPRTGAAAPVTGAEASPASRGGITNRRERVAGAFHNDAGGASRFFYVAKASRREREAGLEGMPERVAQKWNSGGIAERRMETAKPLSNVHPTVKPIALMRWLCRLVTPPGGVVLDPFTGSGTTGCAAVLEGFGFVGIEREAEYVAIAERRIAHWERERAPLELAL